MDFENTMIAKNFELEDLVVVHERSEKMKSAQLEQATKNLESLRGDCAKLSDMSKIPIDHYLM